MTNDEGDPHPAWTVEADAEDYKNAAKFLVSAVEPEASPERAAFLARLLRTKEYTKAELGLVMRELPFDPDASHNYGKGFNPADVQRIVDEHRELRARLNQKLTSEQRDDLIARCPKEIDPDDFECAGFDEHDNPLWMYVPGIEHSDAPEPQPHLDNGSPPSRDREDAEGMVAFDEATRDLGEQLQSGAHAE